MEIENFNNSEQGRSGISLTQEEFYSQLTASSTKFISPETQEKFRNSNILVAGVGSVGNPIAMMCARSGAENIKVLDPDVVAIDNLSRQQYTLGQVGMNKAEATEKNIRNINPFINIESINCGLTHENAEDLVRDSDIVIDAVDIRSLDMIYELHRWASFYKKPVLVGYDLAGTAMVAVYRYDKENIKPLRGELTQEKIDEFNGIHDAYSGGRISNAEFLSYVYDAFTGPINPLKVPVEQLKELIERDPNDGRTYQLGTTATVLSALMVESMRRIVAGEDVKDVTLVDILSQVRRSNPKVISRIPLLLRTLAVVNTRGKRVKDLIKNLG